MGRGARQPAQAASVPRKSEPASRRVGGVLMLRVRLIGGPADGRVIEVRPPVLGDLVQQASGARYGFGHADGRPVARFVGLDDQTR